MRRDPADPQKPAAEPFASERRRFLKNAAAASAGFVFAFSLPLRRAFAQAAAPVAPNAFVRVAPDDTVTVLLKHVEMGQGVWTSIPMAIAEELGCDWDKVRVEHAPAAPAYHHTAYGIQATGGSSSTWESFDQMRTAGAAMRQMLVAAGAARLGARPRDCRVERGHVVCGARRVRFGEVAQAAARLPVPRSVKLKDPREWTLLGKPTRRLDSFAKITGRAEFGIDVIRPDMAVALVARAPAFGARLARYDATRARALPGVLDVVAVPSGVAVLGRHYWAAKLGRDALVIEWDEASCVSISTSALAQSYRKLAQVPGVTARSVGDVDAALRGAPNAIEAVYEVPFLAHAPMEPENCTVEIGERGCDIWTGTQLHSLDQAAAAQILGLPPERVRIHTPFLGGGFGRRGIFVPDFVAEAVHVAKASGRTVKVVWSREDDIRGGLYRPAALSRMRASLGADGRPRAWAHTIVSQSIFTGTAFEAGIVRDGVDQSSVEGAFDAPYLAGVAACRVDLHTATSPVSVTSWRSVGHSHTAFAVESFVDELAHAAGLDPLAYRRLLLPEGSRERRVLDLAADKFGWGGERAPGRAAGMAVHGSFGSVVAQIAEVSVDARGIRVHRVVCAIDCGTVVNPLNVEAQMQSGIVFGLSAALYGELTIAAGRVRQSNYHDYRVLRLDATPQIDVHIVTGGKQMGGCGEPGVPPIAPAVANAVFAATGRRLRRLPLTLA